MGWDIYDKTWHYITCWDKLSYQANSLPRLRLGMLTVLSANYLNQYTKHVKSEAEGQRSFAKVAALNGVFLTCDDLVFQSSNISDFQSVLWSTSEFTMSLKDFPDHLERPSSCMFSKFFSASSHGRSECFCPYAQSSSLLKQLFMYLLSMSPE